MYNQCICSSLQATGDMTNLIMIWEAETCKHLYKFTGHKGPVSVRPVPFLSGTNDFTHQTHVAFCRVSPSGRGLTTSTVRLTTARSKCGTWMKTPTWKLCRYLRTRRLLIQWDGTCSFLPSVSAALATRTPSRAWTVWAASAAWRREGGTVRWGCGRSPRSLSWCSTATGQSVVCLPRVLSHAVGSSSEVLVFIFFF